MIEVILITGRTISQGEALERGKLYDAYTDAVAICELDPEDMERLSITEGDTVKVSTETGDVALKAVKSTQAPHVGIAFIPLGPWANAITGPGSDSTGMPPFKGLEVKIEPAKDARVLGARELIREVYYAD